jgi:hypothetical protein
MHVQTENQERPCELLQLFNDALLATTGGEHLIHPVREGVRAGCGDRKTHALRCSRQFPPRAKNLFAKFRHIATDPGTYFHDRLMQLTLDLIAKNRGAGGEQLGHVRSQFPGMRIDDLELFLDSHGEPVGHSVNHT